MLTIDFPEKNLSVKARTCEDITAWVELPRVHLCGSCIEIELVRRQIQIIFAESISMFATSIACFLAFLDLSRLVVILKVTTSLR